MKAKIPSGSNNAPSLPKMVGENRKNSRSSNERRIRTEEMKVLPPLQLDHVVDLKIPISHSIQVEHNGKEGQITGLRSVGFKGGKMGAEVLRSNDKPPSSDVPVTTTNEWPASSAVLKAAVILRSEPCDLTQMDPVGGMDDDNRSIGDRIGIIFGYEGHCD